MKQSLAFLAVGATWIFFCGFMGLEFPLHRNDLPRTLTPSPSLVLDLSSPQSETVLSPFFSSLNGRWQTDRLLATSA